jgi:glutathione S-transferase
MFELQYLNLCPFSRAVILLLNELNIQYKATEERNYANISLKYEVSEKKNFFEYPNLTMEKSFKITGLYSISEYFGETNEHYKKMLFGENVTDRIQCRSTIEWMERDLFQNITKVILYEKIFKNYDTASNTRSPDSILIRETESNLKKYLLYMQSILENSEYLAGNKISLADFVLASNISVLDYFNHIIWTMSLKRLKHWYLIIKSRPNFKNLLQMKIQGFHSSKQYACIDF